MEAFQAEREKYQVTGEMQSHELQRLQSSSEQLKDQAQQEGGVNSNMVKEMSERIDKMRLALDEKEKEY